MKIKITITKHNTVLHASEREVVKEGDLEKSISSAMTDARHGDVSGTPWDFCIQIDKAQESK